MHKKDRGFSIVAAARSLQVNVSQAGPAAGASYTLIGAILLLGGLGYVLDGRLDTAPWLLFGGLGAGIVVGFYQLVRMSRPR
jgi:F0F1-type ATP synthase assembly protein I